MKLLLDTSFLLPTVGIDIDNEILKKCLKKLENDFSTFELFYSQINLVEISWVYLNERKSPNISSDHEQTFQIGMKSIETYYQELNIPPTNYLEAINIKYLGHSDLFDCLHYINSKNQQIQFLSLDDIFFKFLKKNNFSTKFYLLAKDFI
ncbi:MAG: hypothetical protein HeimC3_14770 [Candidatus Heimdallarchaeota archaeon LC_3]|nr:MAG: hypothetical protein HeimC3_14770 [Candidatus Heimdallarchaeota archaeon LC_3]